MTIIMNDSNFDVYQVGLISHNRGDAKGPDGRRMQGIREEQEIFNHTIVTFKKTLNESNLAPSDPLIKRLHAWKQKFHVY